MVLVPDRDALSMAAGRLAPAATGLLRATIQYRDAVALGEIAAGLGNLSPTHDDTPPHTAFMGAIHAGAYWSRDESDWLDVGLTTGTLGMRSEKPKSPHSVHGFIGGSVSKSNSPRHWLGQG